MGKLATAKLSSSKSSRLSLKNSSSSEKETTLCFLAPLNTPLSVVVVKATKELNPSSESDSSNGSKAGKAACVSSRGQVKEESSETGVRAASASASSEQRAGNGGNLTSVDALMTDSPVPTVRCRGSQNSKLVDFDA